jgi:hypothetical protein
MHNEGFNIKLSLSSLTLTIEYAHEGQLSCSRGHHHERTENPEQESSREELQHRFDQGAGAASSHL